MAICFSWNPSQGCIPQLQPQTRKSNPWPLRYNKQEEGLHEDPPAEQDGAVTAPRATQQAALRGRPLRTPSPRRAGTAAAHAPLRAPLFPTWARGSLLGLPPAAPVRAPPQRPEAHSSGRDPKVLPDHGLEIPAGREKRSSVFQTPGALPPPHAALLLLRTVSHRCPAELVFPPLPPRLGNAVIGDAPRPP